jgi:hypothetical protein
MLSIDKIICASDRWTNECGASLEWHEWRKSEVPREEPVLVPLCPPQIPLVTVKGQWLCAWLSHAMVYYICSYFTFSLIFPKVKVAYKAVVCIHSLPVTAMEEQKQHSWFSFLTQLSLFLVGYWPFLNTFQQFICNYCGLMCRTMHI